MLFLSLRKYFHAITLSKQILGVGVVAENEVIIQDTCVSSPCAWD